MTDFLTARELQAMLKVDRSTIYRMADRGELPAVRVGNQWRFPRRQVEQWLHGQEPGATAGKDGNGPSSRQEVRRLLPLACVQQLVDAFADILGVMILVTDLEGHPITRPSNPCGLFLAAEASPVAHRRCLALWAEMAQTPSLQPTWVEGHLGLLCARAFVRVGSELCAMVVAGGIAPAHWPPDEATLARIAADLALTPEQLRVHLEEVHHLTPEAQERLLPYVQRIADVVAHIVTERQALFRKLQDIAQLSRLEPDGLSHQLQGALS
ncbi:PocR ligand-binding domain-containing protein [Litorilinea aerophila]|uniref:PocR ligand-binding domain-containing protein n=1 Tax=Litorilinea aerophila TaxID=1204385 RepID=UPI0014776797|nr:PocR ligand-binding domain-containing protein [Litorilinea aerophila]MCC9078030.1 PocR ligand-binding domain-containing protein [Litorilinea aerophila]